MCKIKSPQKIEIIREREKFIHEIKESQDTEMGQKWDKSGTKMDAKIICYSVTPLYRHKQIKSFFRWSVIHKTHFQS